MTAETVTSDLVATVCTQGYDPYGRDRDTLVLHDLFIEQAVKTPDSIAVIDGNNDVQMTYKELDDITDQYAAMLYHEYNVRPDTVVGILMPRCAEYVVAYIAVLKAGGAYMPLELVYPKQLLDNAIEQVKANVVITVPAFESRVAEHKHLILDDIPTLMAKVNGSTSAGYDLSPYQEYHQGGKRFEPNPRPKPDDLAFVVMSSGTTGAPKGICQVHRAAIHSYLDRFDRFPYSTDPSNPDRDGAGVFFVWELYRPLCRGAICVIIPDHVLFDPVAVATFIENYNITRILFTPSLLQLILDSLQTDFLQDKLKSLTYMWLCGEVVTTHLAQSISTLLPEMELLNLYSISECHDVTIGDLKRDLDPSQKYATCGVRIPGVSIYIVDMEEQATQQSSSEQQGGGMETKLKLVRHGETGEVYVGGPVLGRGYLHMPEKTKERFVPNVFDDKWPLLYRTGDLGRLIPTFSSSQNENDNDGLHYQLEILGRCDFMVKIRGYSVVLGAIETALVKHDQLSSAVVIAVGDENSKGDKKLVAYVVPKSWKNPPSAASVRTFLKDHVPPYAIPSTFCVIDALPVNASAAGKVNRKDLPPLEIARRLKAFDAATDNPATEDDTNDMSVPQRLAPENDTEKMLFKIWSDLLDLPQQELSSLDSFYEVGGHSLLATRMVQQINKKLQEESAKNGDGPAVSIQIVDTLRGRTIRGIAKLITDKQQEAQSKTIRTNSASPTINLMAEAESLDPSIYPFPTRKGNSVSRFRLEKSLLPPRAVFLTGATGYLGAHILSELLIQGHQSSQQQRGPPLTVMCLIRASDDDAARERLIKTLKKYNLYDHVMTSLEQQHKATKSADNDDDHHDVLESRLIAVAGDLSKPLFGMEFIQFKSLALEVDSIIHCGAQVNLVEPYEALKQCNVLGTQEVLRLATTNGFVKTKVKPVHYISTNGIFPINADAYATSEENKEEPKDIICAEDCDLTDPSLVQNLHEGYSMTKWVAERMCTIAESRGLPVSVFRPGNMAGSSRTGVQNDDDLNTLMIRGMIQLGCAPTIGTNYKLDLTPVDFAAKAVVELAVHNPQRAIGQRFHLQTSQHPVSLTQITEWLQSNGHALESVTRDEWIRRVEEAAKLERQQQDKKQSSPLIMQQLESGWEAFEQYFLASVWMRYGSSILEQALEASNISCPPVDPKYLSRLYPLPTSN